MKKVLLPILFLGVNALFAFPPTGSFEDLLTYNGKVEKNTIKPHKKKWGNNLKRST